MGTTGVDAGLDHQGLGFVVNAPCSEKFQLHIQKIQTSFRDVFGSSVFLPTEGQVHITLCDLMTTAATYTPEEWKRFEELREGYTQVIREITESVEPFEVTFDTIELFPPCIILKGKDNGVFQTIRSRFMERVELLGMTKPPPPIIHSTIVAFREPVDLQKTKAFMDEVPLPFQERITGFRLVKETINRHQSYEVLESFPLSR